MKKHIAEASGDFSHKKKPCHVTQVLDAVSQMIDQGLLESSDQDPPVLSETSSVNVPLSDSNSITHIK
jgi:hypothetical protein